MTRIFLETSTKNTNESQFITYILESFLQKKEEKDYRLVNVGGFEKLAKFDNEFLASESDNDKNIIIFDADYPETDGGFEQRKQWLLQQKKDLGIDFDMFLFPNNIDDGIFETLLQKIINPKHTKMLDFFKEYESKVKNYNETLEKDTFETPDEKARIYSYISAFKRSNREREKFKNAHFWDFGNTEYWDLTAEELKPLIEFLKTIFNSGKISDK